MVRRMTFSFSIFVGYCRFLLCCVLLPLTDSRDTVSSEECSAAAITSPVIQFIESSTMGDFEYRLEIITTFIIHLASVNGNKNGELHHIDWNLGKDYLHQKILVSKFNLAATSKTCETDCLELITFRFLRQFASSLWLGSDSSKKDSNGAASWVYAWWKNYVIRLCFIFCHVCRYNSEQPVLDMPVLQSVPEYSTKPHREESGYGRERTEKLCKDLTMEWYELLVCSSQCRQSP